MNGASYISVPLPRIVEEVAVYLKHTKLPEIQNTIQQQTTTVVDKAIEKKNVKSINETLKRLMR